MENYSREFRKEPPSFATLAARATLRANAALRNDPAGTHQRFGIPHVVMTAHIYRS